MATDNYKAFFISPEIHEAALRHSMRRSLETGERVTLKEVVEEAVTQYLNESQDEKAEQ